MLILTAKLLSTVALPLLALAAWQRHSPAVRTCIVAAIAMVVLYNLVKWPLETYVETTSFLAPHLLFPIRQVTGITVASYLFYALLKQSVDWLLFRYAFKDINTTRDSIIYGLIYGIIAIGFSVWKLLRRFITHAAYDIREFPPDMTPNILQILQRITEIPLEFTFSKLNTQLDWYFAAYALLNWTIPAMIFHVSITIALIYSVRHGKAWPFIATVLAYALGSALGSIHTKMWWLDTARYLVSTYEIASAIAQTMHKATRPIYLINLPDILSTTRTVLVLILGIYAHKALKKAHNSQTENANPTP